MRSQQAKNILKGELTVTRKLLKDREEGTMTSVCDIQLLEKHFKIFFGR